MATEFDDLLEHRVTIRRYTVADGDLGAGQAETWADVATDVPALIQPLTPVEQQAFGAQQEGATEKLWLAATVDIRARDRVTDGSRTREVVGAAQDYDALSLGLQCVRLRGRDEG